MIGVFAALAFPVPVFLLGVGGVLFAAFPRHVAVVRCLFVVRVVVSGLLVLQVAASGVLVRVFASFLLLYAALVSRVPGVRLWLGLQVFVCFLRFAPVAAVLAFCLQSLTVVLWAWSVGVFAL